MQLQRLRLGTTGERRAVLAVVAVTAVLALVVAAQDGLGEGWGAEAAGDGERVGGEVGRLGVGGGGRPGVCRGWVGLTFDDGPVVGGRRNS